MEGAILSLFFRRFFVVGRTLPFDLRKICEKSEQNTQRKQSVR